MSVIIETPSGTIVSYRVAWQADDGRDVYTWRTSGREPLTSPHDFGTVEEAEAFKAKVWHDAKTKDEKADRDAWKVVVT